jgi:uncharacterized protein (DUF2252 family)
MELAAQAQDNRSTVLNALSELSEEQRLLHEKVITLGDKLLPVMRTSGRDNTVKSDDITPISNDSHVFDSIRDTIQFVRRIQSDVDDMLDRVQL